MTKILAPNYNKYTIREKYSRNWRNWLIPQNITLFSSTHLWNNAQTKSLIYYSKIEFSTSLILDKTNKNILVNKTISRKRIFKNSSINHSTIYSKNLLTSKYFKSIYFQAKLLRKYKRRKVKFEHLLTNTLLCWE